MVILLGAMAGLGLLLIVVGLTPRPVREPLAAPEPGYATDEDSEGAGAVQRATRRAARLIERDLHSKSMLIQDANMVGRSLETHALHKMGGLVLGAALLAVLGFFANTLFELELPLLVIVAVALAGGLLGWWVPDSILKSEAEKERVLFQQVTESWLELVAQLVTAGADTFGALAAAASYSEQPGFVVIRDARCGCRPRAESRRGRGCAGWPTGAGSDSWIRSARPWSWPARRGPDPVRRSWPRWSRPAPRRCWRPTRLQPPRARRWGRPWR